MEGPKLKTRASSVIAQVEENYKIWNHLDKGSREHLSCGITGGISRGGTSLVTA